MLNALGTKLHSLGNTANLYPHRVKIRLAATNSFMSGMAYQVASQIFFSALLTNTRHK